jgi:hypothetical protein
MNEIAQYFMKDNYAALTGFKRALEEEEASKEVSAAP